MRDYSFGNFLHELRVRRGLSQYQLGALVGVTGKAVSKWENGTAKPQSRILFKLSDTLGVTVDELLACRYRSTDEKAKGVFAMRNKFKEESHAMLREKYGWPTDMRVMNRWLSEYREMNGNDDWIAAILLLSRLSAEAKEKREHIQVRGNFSGASFISYVMGGTEINPLPPHYYCPHCKKIEFSDEARCGWDLPRKNCSCGREFVRDGHNIPPEMAQELFRQIVRLDISVSANFHKTAKELITSVFSDRKIITLVKEDKKQNEYFVILNYEIPGITDGQILPHEEYYQEVRQNTVITMSVNEKLDAYRRLEEGTNTSFDRIPFASSEILEEFVNGNRDGIEEFRADFYSDMMEEVQPKNIHELIRLAGLSHGTGVWTDNAQVLIREGKPLGEVIVYQEDVFEYIQNRMNAHGMYETGWAHIFMKEVMKGKYADGDGMWSKHKKQLSEIGVEPWFIESVQKIKYLFPRGLGTLYVKYALILMWYKLHYPNEFGKIMSD